MSAMATIAAILAAEDCPASGSLEPRRRGATAVIDDAAQQLAEARKARAALEWTRASQLIQVSCGP
jgi:hypothetical protein